MLVDGQLAGWCGILLTEGEYEIAIVLEDRFWGEGKAVFREVMGWAEELGHQTIRLHLLHTRPEYRFLRRISRDVFESEIMGSHFTTYVLDVR